MGDRNRSWFAREKAKGIEIRMTNHKAREWSAASYPRAPLGRTSVLSAMGL